jgi:hypothetical protein
MRTWQVVVMRQQLEPDVHLEFYETNSTENCSVPPLAVGDRLKVRLASSNNTGSVTTPGDDVSVIEVNGVRWRIRRAMPTERQFRSPRGMTTLEWIVEERLS